MAEARSAISELHVVEGDEDNSMANYFRLWRKSLVKQFFTTWNSVCNGVWPTPFYNIGVTIGSFSVILMTDWEWAEPIRTRLLRLGDLLHIHAGIPMMLRIPLISLTGGITFFIGMMYIRRWLLRMLLSYRGWMFEGPKSQSIMTILWGLSVRVLSGYSPTLYSYQRSLPALPVPKLKDTLRAFLLSIKPIFPVESENYQKFEQEAKVFEKTLGPKLQRLLHLKSWWSQNYVTDWWEKYVYLMGRSPLPINSNFFIFDQGRWYPTRRQCSRTAFMIYSHLKVKRLVDREQFPPLVLRGTVPVCMIQYDRVFGTTRVPGEKMDEVCTFPDSKHVTVQRKGLFYKLDIYDTRGNVLSPETLEQQLEWIIQDADKQVGGVDPESRSLPALTSLERTKWATLRQKYLCTPDNCDSLKIVEEALFNVVLETAQFDTWNERGKHLLHGDGATFWFDKSFNLLIFADGKFGINAEHSWGDAPVLAHVEEFGYTAEVMEGCYDEKGFCLAPEEIRYKQAPVKQPSRVVWNVKEDLGSQIKEAYTLANKVNEDLDYVLADFKSYGKGFVKTCKTSPDAYIQVALQLTYYRLENKLALTYEASTTRLYLLGRTETVRSLTNEAADFVIMFDKLKDSGQDSRSLLKRKLQNACDKHQQLYREAMTGQGLDRHLFALYVVAKGLGHESSFLSDALMLPWTLSTSQQPQQQIATSPDCNDPKYDHQLCPGGGFGPVVDEGYGVSYMIPGDRRLFFHVTSKKSAPNTNSQKFMDCLFKSLEDMKAVFSS